MNIKAIRERCELGGCFLKSDLDTILYTDVPELLAWVGTVTNLLREYEIPCGCGADDCFECRIAALLAELEE